MRASPRSPTRRSARRRPRRRSSRRRRSRSILGTAAHRPRPMPTGSNGADRALGPQPTQPGRVEGATRRRRRRPAMWTASGSELGRVTQLCHPRSAASMPGGGSAGVGPSDHDDGEASSLTTASCSTKPACSSWNQATEASPRRQHKNTRLPSRSAGKSTSPVSGSRSRMPSSASVVRSSRRRSCAANQSVPATPPPSASTAA